MKNSDFLFQLFDFLGDFVIFPIHCFFQKRFESMFFFSFFDDNVHIVMIANTQESVFYNMDDRVRSRLIDSKRIQFKAYTSDQLQDILMDRAEWGLDSSAIDSSLIKKIALSSEGDARIAIGVLRAAARMAEERDKKERTREMIQEAVPEAKDNNRRKNEEKLNDHQEKLYDILNEEGEIKPGDL